MTRKKKKRGITPWKKTALKVCVLWLLMAAGIHGFRLWKVTGFDDQREASRWGAPESCAQVSAFLPTAEAMKEEEILELEYKINTSLAQDSIKLTAEGEDARLWQDCYSGIGNLTLEAGGKTVTAEAVGTGGAFFTFHPLKLSSGSYYLSDSVMKDEILLDEETAWKLFGAFDVEGRTVRVQDLYLRIAGVYKKGEGSLYEKGGLSDYVVFVQYKTLLQYGGSGNGSDMMGQSARAAFAPAAAAKAGAACVPVTASRPGAAEMSASAAGTASDGAFLIASEGPADAGGEVDEAPEEMAEEAGQSSDQEEEAPKESSDAGSQAVESSGQGGESSGAPESGETTQSGTGDGQGDLTQDTQNNENVGTTNTNYKDTGMITTYEIVMPDPVEGYAAAVVQKALGEESGAIVVDNTNRYEPRSLIKDIQNFALLGMRTRSVRYPYWENVAMGWQTIFAALFLLECILIVLTILLLVWLVIHYFRHKSWTLAGSIQNLQDGVYERQSRKRYPEYYREKEEDKDSAEEEPAEEETNAPQADEDKKDKGRLEDKGLEPFEKIPENRKAVEYETKYQDHQRGDGSGAGTDNDGMRRRKQQ